MMGCSDCSHRTQTQQSPWQLSGFQDTHRSLLLTRQQLTPPVHYRFEFTPDLHGQDRTNQGIEVPRPPIEFLKSTPLGYTAMDSGLRTNTDFGFRDEPSAGLRQHNPTRPNSDESGYTSNSNTASRGRRSLLILHGGDFIVARTTSSCHRDQAVPWRRSVRFG